MSRVVHFEFSAQDPERAARFYADVFGWKFRKWDGPNEYWLITTGPEGEPGINGGMMRPCPDHENPPANGNVIGVESVDATVAKIEASGGVILMPKMAVPGVGWLAYFKDADGNMFGVMQDDTRAA